MTGETLLSAVVIEPKVPARAAVVWLHGLGADGHDFEPIVPELGLDPALGVRFVFPHAPRIPVTVNGGMVMPAWYDIVAMDFDRAHDRAGIERSSAQVAALIEDQVAKGIPNERIVLAGFSQGGAIALHRGLRTEPRLAGIVALSTYLVLDEDLEPRDGPPVFQAHGSHDPVVAFEHGKRAHERLRELGVPATFTSYPMQHQVCLEEIEAIGHFLGRVLAD